MLAVNYIQKLISPYNYRCNDRKNINFCAWERTSVGIKCDAFERGLAEKLENDLFRETGLKKIYEWIGKPTREKMEKQYILHKNKPFFSDWITYLTGGNYKSIVLEGEDAIKKCRQFVEKIREHYKVGKRENLMHASRDSKEAYHDIENFFPCNNF